MVGVGPANCFKCGREISEIEFKGDVGFWSCPECGELMGFMKDGKLRIVVL